MTSSIRVVYDSAEPPNFPATDQHPDAKRYRVGKYWVDAVGDPPTDNDVRAVFLTTRSVDIEKNRRLSVFPYGGKVFDFDDKSQANISAAFSIAMAAVMAGAEAGDLRWADLGYDFSWITSANETVTMDAHEVVAFGKAAAAWKSAHIFKARALKDANPIPQDYASDAHWPAS